MPKPAGRDGLSVDTVHAVVRAAIIDGTVVGEVSQMALARRFEVGRTALREAVRMLQDEGLLIASPNQRVRVAELSAADAEELAVMRIALEAVALHLTAPTLGPIGVAELEGFHAQMKYLSGLGDPSAYARAHREFHLRLVSAAGERITASIERLIDYTERYQASFATEGSDVMKQRIAEHRRIIDAITANDSDGAVLALLEHYGRATADVFTRFGGESFEPVRLHAALAALGPGSEDALSAGMRESRRRRRRSARAESRNGAPTD